MARCMFVKWRWTLMQLRWSKKFWLVSQSQLLLAGAGICRDLEYTLGRMTTQAAWLCHTSFPVCNKNCCCDFFSTRVYLEGVRMCWRGGHSKKGLEWPDRGGSVAKLILWKVHWVRCGSSAHRMFAGHSLNLEKGCRALSEQLANNSKYVGWKLIATWRCSIVGYLLHNRRVLLHILLPNYITDWHRDSLGDAL